MSPAPRATHRFPASSLALVVVAVAVLQLDRTPCLAGDTCDLGFAAADTAIDPLLGGGSQLGSSIAVLGDVTGDGTADFAGGAPLASGRGQVIVFSGVDRSVACRIEHPQPTQTDRFGLALTGGSDLDLDGVPDFVVAAPLDDDRGADSGSLLVFSGDDCGYRMTITDPAGAAGDGLGSALALVPDLDGDGVSDIVAGAPLADVQGADAGSVVVFSGLTGLRIVQLLDPEGAPGDKLGSSVAALPDMTNDGVPEIAAGAPSSSSIEIGSGSVVVFSGADGSVVHRMTDAQGGALDRLGMSIAASADLDGDGVPELLAGVPGDDTARGTNAGSVVVFSGATGEALFKLTDPIGLPGDALGMRVAGLADLTSDGVPDVVAAATGVDIGGALGVGRLTIFSGLDGTVALRLADPHGAGGDELGLDLAVLDDVLADGALEIAAGSRFDDEGGQPNVGSIKVFAFEADCDGDGFSPRGGDCDDLDPARHPGASEVCDGIDADCDGYADETGDCDGDGISQLEGDCDDTDARAFPGATEACDGVDNDCDGVIDEGFALAPEICDGQDNDCDGLTDEDTDLDGFTVCEEQAQCPGAASPDTDRSIHPEAPEVCDRKDNDCNGAVDDGPDGDGDGSTAVCDCQDDDPTVHPGALETCDHRDEDCDGREDEDTTRTFSRKVIDPQSLSLDQLGYSVTELGDVTGDGVPDFATGVPFDVSSNQSGRVVVYSGADLSIHCRFFHPQPTPGDVFGQALAGGRDLDADGVPDLVVGTPLADDRGLNSGALHVYSGAGCAWLRTLADPDGADGDQLGLSVAMIDDLDGDGVAEVAGGAYRDDTARGIDAGSVVVFSGRTGDRLWKLEDPVGLADARLGVAVAGAPDVTGDGVPDVLAGAYNDSLNGAQTGALILFSGAAGTLVRKLVDPGREPGDQLGVSVAVSADLDLDAYPDLLGGAYLDDTTKGVDAGSVVIFSGRTGAFLGKLIDPQGDTGDQLGFRVVGYSDMDNDGRPEVVAASPVGNTPRGIDAGRVTIFSGRDGSVVERLTDPAGAAADRLGVSLAVIGDLSGDGVPEVAAGARSDDEMGLENVGSLLLFVRDSDCDADGHSPYQGDCRDDDPTLWRAPGEARNLRFTSTTELAWDAPVEAGGPAQAYDVLRSDEAQSFAAAVCVESDDGADTVATDPQVPPPGFARFYLVRADGACGSGSLGATSTGNSRSAPPCP